MADTIQPIAWTGDAATGVVEMIDQRLLPTEETINTYDTYEGVGDAIRSMVIRGAPAIGIAAAMGMVLGARQVGASSGAELVEKLSPVESFLASRRPTAVNLFWALERMMTLVRSIQDQAPDAIVERMLAEANTILAEDIAMNHAMGKHGAALLPEGANILTHCNAGALATGGYGTALGVIRAAHERARETGGPDIHVWVDETRPFLQGARLTAWELVKEEIPVTLITDNMAGYFMQQGKVDAIVTGSDRVVANGDVANKIGTYALAVLAKHHGIPFYVAIPTSTLDMNTPSGDLIEIEQRPPVEVHSVRGQRIAPEIQIAHPAFDVTPHDMVSAIVTEKGVALPPYTESLAKMASS